MKAKIFFGGAMAALVLGMTACAIDEVVQTNPIMEDTEAIGFKATLGHSTRATAVTSNQLKEFSVWGWNGDGMFMSHERFYAEGAYYESDSLYLWPSIGADFVALIPVIDEEVSGDGTSVYLGGEVEDDDVAKSDKYYTGHFAQATIDANGGAMEIKVDTPADNAEQVDLCYAVAMDNPYGSYVTLNFRHALSQVVFKAKNTNPDMQIDIAGVSLCSISKTGQYTLPLVNTVPNLDGDNGTTEPADGTQGSWVVGDAITESVFSGGMKEDHVTLSTDTTRVSLLSDSGALFLIPQKTDGWDVENDHYQQNGGAYFRVNCRITEFGSQLWPSNSEGAGEYAEIAMPVEIDWEEGYRYTYTFIFGYGAGYYPPDDPNDPESGTGATPVLNIVNFSVSVDEFQDAAGDYDIWTEVEEVEDEEEPEPEPEPDTINISLVEATSSTITVEWDYNGVTDFTKIYNAGLWLDANRSNQWVIWTINDLSVWATDSYQLQRFTFTGLDPGTTYYARIEWADDTSIHSDTIPITTPTFDHVVSTNAEAQVGDVLVAEDFHGLIHGGDMGRNALGVSGSGTVRQVWTVPRGTNPWDASGKPVECDAEWNVITGSSDSYLQATGLYDWCMGTSTNVSTRPGYVKIGGSKAYSYLATPVLSTIPEGKTATVKVDFSVMGYSTTSNYCNNVLVAVVDNAEVSSHQAAGWTTTEDGAVPVDKQLVDVTGASGLNMEFKDFSVTLSGVSNVSRIRISSDTTIDASDQLTRFLLDNVVVTVVSIDENEPAGRTEEIVYFEDDLDWLEPYAEAVNQADVIATGDSLTDAKGNTFSTTYIAAASVNDVSAAEALREHGYSFLLNSGAEDSYVVIMPGYLYVYANNANHIGSIHLPELEQLPAEGDPVWIDLKWCPGASTKLNLNNINLVVVVKNGDTETQFEVGETTSANQSLHWDSVSIELKDVTINANTEFIIRPTDEYWNATDSNNHCWFIDDFKIYTPAD